MFVIFVLTGQYMDKVHNHLEGVEIGVRMIYRSRHIFILLSSFLHLALGLYYENRFGNWQQICQRIGSVALTGSSLLLVYAFFIEAQTRDLKTPYSHWAIYLTLAGIILHAISGMKQNKSSLLSQNSEA